MAEQQGYKVRPSVESLAILVSMSLFCGKFDGSVSDLLIPREQANDKKSSSPDLLVFVTLVTKG